MTKQRHSENDFTNEHTIRRRAWIAKALDSVRGRGEGGEEDFLAAEEAPTPHLYVVSSDDSR